MKVRRRIRAGHIPALVMMALMLQGCTAGRYAYDRVADALDIVELGVTVSKTPQFAFYWNSLDLLTFGYSDFDGYFAGWGGRHLGVTRLKNKCQGFVIAREEVVWGDNEPRKRYGGLAGVPGLVGGLAQDGHPLDSPACVHFFPHIGYLGLVWNVRWGEIVDFVVGWTTIDLNQDDTLYRDRPGPTEEPLAARGETHRMPTQLASRPAPAPKPAAPASLAPTPPTPDTPEPAPTPPKPAAPRRERVHVVKKGDTLYGISRTYFGTSARWRDIRQANTSVISDKNLLQPGMKLVIPEK